jgi:magnesium chelatase family protein
LLSGSLLDIIATGTAVPAVQYEELRSELTGENFYEIRQRVNRARQIQLERLSGEGIYCNASMRSRQIRRHCRIADGAEQLLEVAIKHLGLSARAYDRILKVSRTIADLAESDIIQAETHI